MTVRALGKMFGHSKTAPAFSRFFVVSASILQSAAMISDARPSRRDPPQ